MDVKSLIRTVSIELILLDKMVAADMEDVSKTSLTNKNIVSAAVYALKKIFAKEDFILVDFAGYFKFWFRGCMSPTCDSTNLDDLVIWLNGFVHNADEFSELKPE